MTNSVSAPALFRAIKGGRKAGTPVACALLLDTAEPLSVSTLRLSWTPLIAARFREVARAAGESTSPEGRSLPFASLRAVLQVEVPEAVMLVRELGKTWAREAGGAFMHAAARSDGDVAARTCAAIRTWASMVLRPWAIRVGIDEALVDAIDEAAEPGDALLVDSTTVDLADLLASGQGFDRVRHPVLQEVSRRLEGLELFPGLGLVRRIIRARSGGNEVQFETWPTAAKSGGLFSMVATFELITVPYLGKPILTVRASRRRWLEALPKPGALGRQRKLSFHLMGHGGPPIALEGSTWVRSGVPEEPCSPEFMHQALAVRADLSLPLADMVRLRGQDVFLGIPYAPSRDGTAKVGSGASTRDQVDLLDAVAGPLAGMGFRPLPFREADEPARRHKREEEHHKALELQGLVGEVATALGSNELGEDDLLEAARMLLADGEPPAIPQQDALAGRAALELLREANRARVRRVHGARRPTIVLLARLETERQLMRAAIDGLFGASVEVVERQLPRDVHGLRAKLPEADKPARARFAVRVEAWRETAMDIASSYGGSHALVQADRWYEGRPEDRVNKMAGRQALATIGDANVQYLLPPEPGWRGIERYMHRVQSAVYDLMFGHAALVSEVGSLLAGAFPDPATRPRAIVGISVVTQARLHFGAGGGQVCLATRIDATTGITTARVGTYGKAMTWTRWLSFFEAMKHIADQDTATLGANEDTRRRSYQQFVEQTIDGLVDDGDRPLVLVDATGARGLWPWLSDARIDGPPSIGPEGESKALRWAPARIVRIRSDLAGQVFERKTARLLRLTPEGQKQAEFDRYTPTATERTVEISSSTVSGARHYWIIGGYLEQKVRGLSVYRNLPHYLSAAKVAGAVIPDGVPSAGLLAEVPFDISDDPYRLPNGLDVTVATLQHGDSADLIADMVTDLRGGYGHSRLDTALPAPLFFEAKARDYMSRFTIDDADDDDGGPDDGGASKAEWDAATAEPSEDDVDPDDPSPIPPPVLREPGPPDGNDFSHAFGNVGPASVAAVSENLADEDTTGGDRTPFAHEKATAADRAEAHPSVGALALEPKKQGREQDMDAAIGGSRWLEASRGKFLPVPDFVDQAWVLDKTSLQGNARLVREIHRHREIVRHYSGFDWPEQCPVGPEIGRVIAGGLAHPNFNRLLTLAAMSALDAKKAKYYHPFKPFSRRVNGLLWDKPERQGGKPVIRSQERSVEAILDECGRDEALAYVYLNVIGVMDAPLLLPVVEKLGLHELDDFLSAAAELDDGFVWHEHIDGPEGMGIIKLLRQGATLIKQGALQPTSVDHSVEADTGASDEALEPTTSGEDGALTEHEDDAADASDDVAGVSMDVPPVVHEEGAGDVGVASFVAAADTMGVQDVTTAWLVALHAVADCAAAATVAPPCQDAVDKLLALLPGVQAALDRWVAAQPRLEDAAPAMERGRAVLARISEVRPSPPVDRVEHPRAGESLVPAEVAQSAAALVGEAERSLAEAMAARADQMAIMADREDALGRIEEMAALGRIAMLAMEVAIAHVGEAAGQVAQTLEQASVASPRFVSDVAARPEAPATLQSATAQPAAEPGSAAESSVTQTAVSSAAAPEVPGPGLETVEPTLAPETEAPVEHLPPDDPAEDPGFELAEEMEASVRGDGSDIASPEDRYSAPADSGSPAAVGATVADEVADPASGDCAPEPSAPEEIAAVDPLAIEMNEEVQRLVRQGAFGSAYHLSRAAARVLGAPMQGFSEAELRLAAMSGHIGHGAMQGSQLLERVVNAAIDAVNATVGESDVDVARRIILAAASAELAMFHPALPAVTGMQAITDTTAELSEAFHDLAAAVGEGARLAIVTPALLRTVNEEAADGRYVNASRAAVIANLDAFSKIRFNWAPANKIRAAMHAKGGPLGELRERISAAGDGAVAAAKAFASQYRARSEVLTLIDRIDNAGAGVAKFKSMDGAARERMLGAFGDLSALCAEYVSAAEAVPSASNSNQKATLQRIAAEVAAGASKAASTMEAFARSADPLSAAAARFATGVLTRLREAATGRMTTPGLHDHMIAVHGPLLWLPGLHYGNGWLPAPYAPEGLLQALLAAPSPPDDIADPQGRFGSAVKARLREGSFVAANLLVQAAAFYGIGEEERSSWAVSHASNLKRAQEHLEETLETSRRGIDKVQRMGGLVRMDTVNALLAGFERIDSKALPIEEAIEARGEGEGPGGIMDFCSAHALVADVNDRIRGLLDLPRAESERRLAALEGRARQADIDHVRRIIAVDDDLVTAGEYIGFMEEGGTLPETSAASRRFREFFPAVPNALSASPKEALDRAADAITSAADLPALPYSRVEPLTREAAVEIVKAWRDLRRRVDGNRSASDVHTMLDEFLSKARLSPKPITTTAKASNLPPKNYVAEFALTVPQDKNSLLLPEFGSVPRFTYRICITPKMPSEGELTLMCGDAGTYAVIILVTSLVDAPRRQQLAQYSVDQKRTALVIDESILLYALSEPEFRPLTMLECAQPFSFALPYRDHGNDPVPPEMFFGRETEIRKIGDRMGSCIVYGGRRLGKTALLRHVQGLSRAAGVGSSTLVGYADIRSLGSEPAKLWDAASRALTPIFPAAVRTYGEFSAKVSAWLEQDGKRRILLLLDEADAFIEGESKTGFGEFSRLQSLMNADNRRFKFVLAGLHNVTRIVRTENSPLKQIASDPLRIGPLVDAELPDAERLVTRPLAALGYEFKSRGNVWRILSHCNYYPVLVQTFCRGLLEALNRDMARFPRPSWDITERHVREAIDNEEIRKEIEAKFGYTIRNIDLRYELIACVVAERTLAQGASGLVDEGMTTVEVLDAVSSWWAVAFDHPNRLEIVKDLLDEMVGLGVLRQSPSGAWALRSHAILRMLDEDTVTKRLLEFLSEPARRAFDPRSMRRKLSPGPASKMTEGHPCPLTMGQEHDLVAQQGIALVLGSPMSDIDYVVEAMRSSDAAKADDEKPAVSARTFARPADLVEAVRLLSRGTAPAILVVDPRTPWDASWVDTLTRQKPVREGHVRVVMVGAPEHAWRWANGRRPTGGAIRLMPLQAWADTFVEHELDGHNLPAERFSVDLRRITAGFNRPMAQALGGTGNADRVATRLRNIEARLAKDRDLLTDLGIAPHLVEVFRRLDEWADKSGRINTEEIRDGAADALSAVGMTAAQLILYATSLALLVPQPLPPGEPAENRAYLIPPLVRLAVAQAPATVAA